MERLTRRDEHGDAWGAKRSVGDYVGDREIRQRLAAYEDIGTPEQCAAGVALMQKQEQGLVVELPCRVGDTVHSLNWSIMNNRHIVGAGTIVNVRYDASDGLVTVSDGERFFVWGIKAFATRAEAEAEAILAGQEDKPCG